MKTIEYVRFEVERQHCDLFAEFEDALCFARTAPKVTGVSSLKALVEGIAFRVEPQKNDFRTVENGRTNLRRSEVGFLHGGNAVRANDVPRCFDRWTRLTYEMMEWDNLRGPRYEEHVADNLIKQLLDIHPWKDGNGRTASILRNWMLGSLWEPTILPYFYGEK